MGGAPRWFLVGDGSLPCMVGAGQCEASACMVTVRIQDATEREVVALFKALRDHPTRIWTKPQRGSVIAFQSLTMLFESGSVEAYLERVEKLRSRLCKEVWGVGEEGEPNIETIPILFPYCPKNDRECQIFSEYIEVLALLKSRTTLPVIAGPIGETFQFVDEGASPPTPLRTVHVRPWPKKINFWDEREKGEAVGVIDEISNYFKGQEGRETGGGGGKGGSNTWVEKKGWQNRRGRTEQVPLFVIDPERAKKLCLDKIKENLGGGEGVNDRPEVETLGVGRILRLREVYGDANWTFGIPIQLLEDWCYALSTELREAADSLGREGILHVPQLSMVRGVGRLHSARVGKCRREACPEEPAPARLSDLVADKARGINPPPTKMDVAFVLGTSSYRELAPTLPSIKVITLALPGLDIAKPGEGRKLGGGVRNLMDQAKTYWGGEEGKKVRAIFLGPYGNSTLKGVKVEGRWGIASDAFNRAELVKRNATVTREMTAVVEEMAEECPGVDLVLIPALPRHPDAFESGEDCFNFFKRAERKVLDFGDDMGLEVATFMEALDPKIKVDGVKGLLASDGIHPNPEGKRFLERVVESYWESK